MHLSPLFILPLFLAAFGAAAQPLSDSIWRDDVKTVQLYPVGAELDPPTLVVDQPRRLVLEFDILSAQAEELRWHLLHCSRNWEPDSLQPHQFINGFESGNLDEYQFSFTTRKDYVHYRALLPDTYARFIHSGNYILLVVNEQGDTLLTRRFWVSEEAVAVRAQLARPYDGIDIDRRQEVDVALSSSILALDPRWITVILQQNGRLDNLATLAFSGYDGTSLAYAHRPQNIFFGGNVFRFFDSSNLRASMYNVLRVEDFGGEYFAILRPDEDRSRKHFIAETNLNGGFKVNAWDRNNPTLESEYLWVNFSLPMSQPLLDGSIHIVGDLTDWKLDSTSRMDYNPSFRAYTKRLLLKQGYYAYQLLVLRPGANLRSTLSATAPVEGDHRETPNQYTVYVYHRAPSDLADRLLAVRREK